MTPSGFLQRQPVRLSLALSLPFAACLVQWVLWDHIGPFAWLLFYPAAFIAPVIGGLWGGVGATLISAVLAWYVFLPPRFSFIIERTSGYVSMIVYVAMGVTFSWFQRRLRTSEEEYHTVSEQAGDGIFVADADGRYVDVNARYCAMLDRPRAEVLGASLGDTMVDITRDHEAEAEDPLATRGTATVDRHLRREDGTLAAVAVTIKPLPDNRRLAIVHDVSDRSQVTAALQASERRLKAALENTVGPAWAIDRQHRLPGTNLPAGQHRDGAPADPDGEDMQRAAGRTGTRAMSGDAGADDRRMAELKARVDRLKEAMRRT